MSARGALSLISSRVLEKLQKRASVKTGGGSGVGRGPPLHRLGLFASGSSTVQKVNHDQSEVIKFPSMLVYVYIDGRGLALHLCTIHSECLTDAFLPETTTAE